MRGAALALLALFALMAGCTGAASPSTGDAVIQSTDEAAPSTIPLRILVINDEYLPVVGATVHIVGLNLNATTDDRGDAFFQVARPGRYSVHTHRVGYYPNVTHLEVDGMAQVKRVWLRDAPRDGHFSDFYYYSAVCELALFAPPADDDPWCPDAPYMPRPTARWVLAGGLQRAQIDLDWDEQPGGASSMRLEVRFPEAGAFADGRTVLVAEGKGPIGITIPPEQVTDKHRQNGVFVEVRAGLPRGAPGANLHQPFHFEAQFDYFVAAPDVQEH